MPIHHIPCRSVVIVATAVLLASPRQLFAAQTNAPTQPRAYKRLLGVYDASTGAVISGAVVRDSLSGTTAETSVTGTVALNFVTFIQPLGWGWVEVAKIGYKPVIEKLSVADTVPVTVVMEHIQSLPTIVSAATYRLDTDPGLRDGIARRCASRLVGCIGQDRFSEKPTWKLGDFLRQVTGVTVNCQAGGRSRTMGSRPAACAALMHGIDGGKCEPTYFINGLRESFAKEKATMLEQIEQTYDLHDVTSVEVYDSSYPRPLRWEGSPNCGAIVVWLR